MHFQLSEDNTTCLNSLGKKIMSSNKFILLFSRTTAKLTTPYFKKHYNFASFFLFKQQLAKENFYFSFSFNSSIFDLKKKKKTETCFLFFFVCLFTDKKKLENIYNMMNCFPWKYFYLKKKCFQNENAIQQTLSLLTLLQISFNQCICLSLLLLKKRLKNLRTSKN